MAQKASTPTTPATFNDLMKLPTDWMARTPYPPFGNQAARFWRAQNRLLQDCEKYTHRWYQRRQAAIREAADAAERIGDADGSADAIVNGLVSNSMERLSEDMRDQLELSVECLNMFTGNAEDAMQEAAEEVSGKQPAGKSRTGA